MPTEKTTEKLKFVRPVVGRCLDEFADDVDKAIWELGGPNLAQLSFCDLGKYEGLVMMTSSTASVIARVAPLIPESFLLPACYYIPPQERLTSEERKQIEHNNQEYLDKLASKS